MFVRRHIIPILLTASLVVTGMIAVTHVHPSGGLQGQDATCGHDHSESGHSHDPTDGGFCDHEHATGPSCCSTEPEQPQNNPERQPSPCDHDHDDCHICHLIAQFSATTDSAVDLVFDSFVTSFRFQSPTFHSIESTLRVRGRAPPTCC